MYNKYKSKTNPPLSQSNKKRDFSKVKPKGLLCWYLFDVQHREFITCVDGKDTGWGAWLCYGKRPKFWAGCSQENMRKKIGEAEVDETVVMRCVWSDGMGAYSVTTQNAHDVIYGAGLVGPDGVDVYDTEESGMNSLRARCCEDLMLGFSDAD